MTGSVAIDVVIGLVFIYLLYSLLTSVIAEIVATNLALRAKNLHSALNRMLNDESVNVFSHSKDVSGILKKLYGHPEIRSLSANNIFNKPSEIDADTFARALVDVLREGKLETKATDIKSGIKSYNLDGRMETYLYNLVDEAQSDLDKLRASLSDWFDTTMINASEWYKRNLQIMLFFIGLIIAWGFNVNTFEVTSKLSVDKEARNQLVELAINYTNNNESSTIRFSDSLSQESLSDRIMDVDDSTYHYQMDTLLSVKRQILNDIYTTQSLLGGGTWLPDSLVIKVNKEVVLPDYVRLDILPGEAVVKKGNLEYGLYGPFQKLGYALRMLFYNFFGYAVTAIALSMGAPFWFNILKNIIGLKKRIKK
ncbi:MAG: hypothetical protein AAGF85_09060 [Bacteroidota bacterium]